MANNVLLPGSLHEVDPISRIEGHLGVKVSTSGGVVIDANAHGNLWRGFENFLLGRDANDAITFTQRICGVCPVPHGMTATYAADAVLGYSRGHITFKTASESGRTYGVPAKAVLIRNLVLGAEFLMSSITHFYHLAAPSYIQGPAIPPWTPYFDNSYYSPYLVNNSGTAGATGGAAKALPNVDPSGSYATTRVWDAVIYSYVKALRIRRLTFEAGALFAGRMPMTSCYVAGGVTNDGAMSGADMTARCNKFRSLMTEVGNFVVSEYVPIALVLGALYPDNDSQAATGPAPRKGVGGGVGRFLAWGGFPSTGDTLLLPGGCFEGSGTFVPATGALDIDDRNFRVKTKADVYSMFLDGGSHAVKDNLTEDIKNSHYGIAAADATVYTGTSAYPGDVNRTKPARASGYSYIKAPRWDGQPCEVGPLARMVVGGFYPVDGSTLASTFPGYALYTTSGGSLDLGIINASIVNGLVNDGLAATAISFILGIKGGISTMDRLRARALESLVILQGMLGPLSKPVDGVAPTFGGGGWIDDLANATGSTWRARPGAMAASLPTYPTAYNPYGHNHGWGGTEAPRGALMHHSTIENGKIVKYQCIVPTTWNGSPKDTAGARGAIEEAMIGAPFVGTNCEYSKQNDPLAGPATGTSVGGVEVLRIAQSFDPCIACAVH